MKRTPKAIRFKIEHKLDAWLSTIDDEKLRQMINKNIVVTGGCIASMLLDERVRDYDVYFQNFETAKAVADYYVNKFNQAPSSVQVHAKPVVDVETHDQTGEQRIRIRVQSQGAAAAADPGGYRYFEGCPSGDNQSNYSYVEQLSEEISDGSTAAVAKVVADADESIATEPKDEDKPKYRPIFMSDNAITLSHGMQLILRFYGQPEEIHENYDFVHCMCYYTPQAGMKFTEEALLSLLSKDLTYVGSKYPICSIIRTRKFIARGWTCNAGQYVKMLFQAAELDLNDVNVLEDQLTGVDTAYFMELVAILRKNSVDGKIDRSYVITLIDKMF